MPINQLESTLQAITTTLAKLEKEGCEDQEKLNSLREERDKILKQLNIN